MSKNVILTGLRANNDLHIGNYFGGLLPIVDMARNRSDEYQINLFVPDLHSFTTPIDHSVLQEQILNNVRLFIAAGLPIDYPDVHVYRQSYISAHSELAWILDCFTGFGEMGRMTQFKDKSAALSADRVSVGLFNYPVLMAADILLYDALYVPVGDDQSQHIEFTRDIAQRMNAKFGELFTVPKPVKEQHAFFGKDQGLRIKDLQNPTKKMSKSDESGKGIIFLSDPPDEAHKKVMSAATDSQSNVAYDPVNQPGVSNLLDMLGLLEGQSGEEIATRYAGQTMYGPLKTELADAMAEFLKKFQARLASVNDDLMRQHLSRSEETMNTVAQRKLLLVQKAVGLR